MDNFFVLVSDFMADILSLLNSIKFRLFGFTVSYLYLVLGFILVTMLVGIFWKGAKG